VIITIAAIGTKARLITISMANTNSDVIIKIAYQ
jgi:hypothetical protein